MSELHKFLFDGLPVRGAIVRLTDAWHEVQQRRAGNRDTGAYPAPVAQMLGQMLAAGVLMQSSIQFQGALVLQVHGDGPVKLAVAEVQSDGRVRATASVQGAVSADANLVQMVNPHGTARCAITLDAQNRRRSQQPYQGVVPLSAVDGHKFETLAQALQFYMQQSEQLPTILVLAANEQVAAGLLVQRMPVQGAGNLAASDTGVDEAQHAEDYERIAHLAASLTAQELLTLDVDTVLRRLFWEEKLLRFSPQQGVDGPRFACTCSRERVAAMLRSLGAEEVQSMIEERAAIDVGCEFCGQHYHFDAVDATQLFAASVQQVPGSSAVQ